MKEATFSRKNLCCNQMNKKGFVSNSISSLILYQKTDFTLYLPIVLKISKTLLQMVSRILMKGYSSIFINFTSFMGLLMFVSIDSKTEIVKHFTIEEKVNLTINLDYQFLPYSMPIKRSRQMRTSFGKRKVIRI